MKRCVLLLAALSVAAVAGCATPAMRQPDSSPQEAAAARYAHPGPSAITLYTMINNRSGAGAHSSMMISAPSQRVIFDPAGSVRAKGVPEIQDVLYGITPAVADFYERAHARESFRVRIQRIEVPPQVAERAIALAQSHGAVGQAQCTQATSGVLRQLPGFGALRQTWFPNTLADQMATLPGVTERVLREDDADDKTLAVAQFETGAAQPRP
ncbi:hypothetical protein [Salipiger marinus]|uniref:hypothetical protein n=1 Tax=Salipiger marinus TaxID=555512 RepID=UPI004059A5AF